MSESDDEESMALVSAAPQAAPTASGPQFTDEQIDLIKRTCLAPDVTFDEFRVFMEVVRHTGLNPLAKQIYAISRWNGAAKRKVMTIQTGIDGYRLIAARTGQLAGIDDAIFDREDTDHPGKATVTVWRMIGGQRCPFTASARWDEYVQADSSGKPTSMWAKMAYTMLAKCAESLALRKGFPNELSALRTGEEMSQADYVDAEPMQQTRATATTSQRTQEGRGVAAPATAAPVPTATGQRLPAAPQRVAGANGATGRAGTGPLASLDDQERATGPLAAVQRPAAKHEQVELLTRLREAFPPVDLTDAARTTAMNRAEEFCFRTLEKPVSMRALAQGEAPLTLADVQALVRAVDAKQREHAALPGRTA